MKKKKSRLVRPVHLPMSEPASEKNLHEISKEMLVGRERRSSRVDGEVVSSGAANFGMGKV